jgi:hypothetical protein
MSILSNLYAERVFSEQPTALWALDDDIDFVSLIGQGDRSFNGWAITNATKSSSSDIVRQIKKSPLTKFVTSNSSGFSAKSPAVFGLSDLVESKQSFNISTYFYSDTDEVSEVRIGYEYEDGTPGEIETYSVSTSGVWVFLSKTYSLPELSSDIKLIFEVETLSTGSYTFYVNGFSVGQWSEKFNAVSDGVDLIDLPENINIPDTMCYPAYAYGFSDKTGYYLATSNNLAAYNDGFPMVFGAGGVTRIVGNSGKPSLIVPGGGFLHDLGRYQDLTLEFWLRVTNDSVTPTKIVGPVFSSDGLYVDGQFLVLKIDRNVQSYFVGEWERPMLVDFRVSPNTASLMINGEIVVSMDVDTASLPMPTGTDDDWIGFYGLTDKVSLDIDCVAIYSYQVPSVVAKRRFVYGQGADVPETINGSLVGSGVTIDYPVSGYANNYIYPDMGRWNQGIVDNLSTDNGTLSTPNYQLPSFVFNNTEITVDEWLDLCAESEGSEDFSSIDFSLADSESKSGAYILFDKFNITGQDTKAVYGIFKTVDDSDRLLFKLSNEFNGSSLEVKISDSKIVYYFSYPGMQSLEVESEDEISQNSVFVAGFDIDKMISAFGGIASRVLSESKKMVLYVAGDKTFANTFNGKIYKVGLATKSNLPDIEDWSNEDGMILVLGEAVPLLDGGEPPTEFSVLADAGEPDSDLVSTRSGGFPTLGSTIELINYVSAYTLAPKLYLGKFIIDIASKGYWQDFVPLSHFGKNVTNLEGDSVPTLSYLQFNIDVPRMDILDPLEPWHLDTSNLPVKTYVSFQYASSGANKLLKNFASIQKALANSPVVPSENWMSTAYEVVSGSVIYLPSGVDYRSLALVYHIRVETKSVFSNSVKIKRLETCSQSLSSHEPLRINTRFGIQISPYFKRGLYSDYMAKNPISIYKRSTPYMHLTKQSGIKMLRYYVEESSEKGISIPVNQNRVSQYAVGAIQAFINYQSSHFPELETKIMEIKAYNRSTQIMLVKSDANATRGKIYAVDSKTGLPDQLVNFYLNGKLVKNPLILAKQWDVLSVQFVDGMKFDNFSGSINLTGELMLFNNISTYRLSEIQTSLTSIFRTWSQLEQLIDKSGDEATYWGDLITSTPPLTWENILFIPTIRRYLIDPTAIFDSYAGTNRISVSDDSILMFKNYRYTAYSDVRWRSNIVSPV